LIRNAFRVIHFCRCIAIFIAFFQTYNISGEEMATAELGATLTQLRKQRTRIERQLAGVNDAIRAISGVVGPGSGTLGRGPRRHSDAVRRKIAKAQKARWARLKQAKAAKGKLGTG
jgi:hypothetical protein